MIGTFGKNRAITVRMQLSNSENRLALNLQRRSRDPLAKYSFFSSWLIGLVASSFQNLFRQACRVCEHYFVASGHLHQPTESQSVGHAWMPAPFSMGQRDVFGGVDVTLGNPRE